MMLCKGRDHVLLPTTAALMSAPAQDSPHPDLDLNFNATDQQQDFGGLHHSTTDTLGYPYCNMI
jgi:hypothetical protein